MEADAIETPCLIVSSAFVPDGPCPDVEAASSLTCDGDHVGWLLPDPDWIPTEADLASSGEATGPTRKVELGGEVLRAPWDLVSGNASRIAADSDGSDAEAPPGIFRIGSHPVISGEDVDWGTGSVFDTRDGPIVLGDRVRVEPHSHLVGPLFVGADSLLLGGAIRASSIGPRCKVRGEVDSSIILGFSNKAHDGFLGHAYLGRWVNLGALTTNSDLKNNYSEVRVDRGSGLERTGSAKVGAFLADHVKTGIGTLLNTGCVIEVGSNVFGGQMPPRYVPPFSWGSGSALEAYDFDRFVATAEVAMGRREQTLGKGMRDLLGRSWETRSGDS